MSSQTAHYARRLDSLGKEIRLLELLPGTWDAPLCATLSYAYLSQHPVYTALSYVWGDVEDVDRIEIDGHECAIRRNLESALRHLRQRSAAITLWIDAVCINQNDAPEKNAQVRMMGDVYSSASNVTIWIGPADDCSNYIFGLARELSNERLDSWDITLLDQFSDLTKRAWFHRAWVIQEMALAREDPNVVSGFKSIPWSTLAKLWKAAIKQYREKWSFDFPDGILGPIDSFERVRTGHHTGFMNSLSELIEASDDFAASDPRDKIYALLGLLRSQDRDSFPVDYEKPTWVVFAEAMRLTFEQGDGVGVLSRMCLHGGKSSVEHIPSWVLDFSNQAVGSNRSCGLYMPSTLEVSSRSRKTSAHYTISKDLSTLSARCLILDTVTQTLVFEETGAGCLKQLSDVENMVDSVRTQDNRESPVQPYMEKYKASESLRSVLVCGQAFPGLDLSRSHVSSAQSKSSIGKLDRQLRDVLEDSLPGRTFFATSRGLTALGMPGVREGDVVSIWVDGDIPFIMRPIHQMHRSQNLDSDHSQASNLYWLVGAGYVGGIMSREAMDDLLNSGTIGVENVRILASPASL